MQITNDYRKLWNEYLAKAIAHNNSGNREQALIYRDKLVRALSSLD